MQEDGKKPEEEKQAEMPADEAKIPWKHKRECAGFPMIEVTLANGQKILV